MVCIGVDKNGISSDNVSIKTFVKIKTSQHYKLHYTLNLSSPRVEETLTTEELMDYYMGSGEAEGENETE